MIKISELEKIYRTEEVETVALNKLSIEVKEGEFVAIMGPSGCGKSTLLNILGLLDDPDAGSFMFNGTEVAHFNERKRADLRKRNIGFVFQSFNLIDELTVFENVELPLMYDRQHRIKDPKKKAIEVLERVGLGDRMDHVPNQLSGGQQQRVAIARALVNEPSLILADEPTGNLDSRTSVEVFGLFQQLNSEGITIVLVTHERDYANFSKRIVELRDGKIIKDKEIEKPLTAKDELEKLKSEEVTQEIS